MNQDSLTNVPEHAKAGLIAMNAAKRPSAELQEVAHQALDLMREGKLLDDIAVALNYSPGRISQLVMEFFPTEWKLAKTAANSIRLERAQAVFDQDGSDPDAPLDGLKLAYARERAKYSLAMLAVTKREMFDLSDKTSINLQAAGNVSIQVVSFAEQNPAIDAVQQVQRTMDSQAIEGEKV